MLTDEQLSQPVTVRNLADGFTLILFEVFGKLAPSPKIGSDLLEDVANQLLDTGRQIGPEPLRSIILATAQGLIESEAGLFEEG